MVGNISANDARSLARKYSKNLEPTSQNLDPALVNLLLSADQVASCIESLKAYCYKAPATRDGHQACTSSLRSWGQLHISVYSSSACSQKWRIPSKHLNIFELVNIYSTLSASRMGGISACLYCSLRKIGKSFRGSSRRPRCQMHRKQ